MSDTHRLDLLEHYQWRLFYTAAGDWQVNGMYGHVRKPSLREAIRAAMDAQVQWALTPQELHRSNDGAST